MLLVLFVSVCLLCDGIYLLNHNIVQMGYFSFPLSDLHFSVCVCVCIIGTP